MADVKAECETVGTRSKRRRLASDKDDTSLYKTSNAESIRGKSMFDTPDESMSELEEFISMKSSPFGKSGMNKCDDKSDFKINFNNLSGNKNRNKSKSPLSNERKNINDYVENEVNASKSKAKSKNRTSRNSLSSTPQKETPKKNKKLSLDVDVLEFKKISNSPECKLGGKRISSKEDISHKSNKKIKSNKNNHKNSEIESKVRTRSKTRLITTPNNQDSLISEEMPENIIQSSSEELSFIKPDFKTSPVKSNKIMETISPIKGNGKTTNELETNSESEEEFSYSSEQSNLSIRENVKKAVSSSANQESDNFYEYSIEDCSQSSKENDSPHESNAKTKRCSKPPKNSRKTKRKISPNKKEISDVDLSETSDNSDDSFINETQVQKASSRVLHKKESKPLKATKMENTKIKASSASRKPSAEIREIASEESCDSSPISVKNSQTGKSKKIRGKASTSKPITPIQRKSQRIIKKDLNKSNASEFEVIPTPKSKSDKKLSSAKSPRTPYLSLLVNEELGLSWDKKCTPPRRYSLRLKNSYSNSESGTPRTSTSVRHSSIGNTPTPSKRKQLLNIDLTNQSAKDLNSDSDSDDCVPTNSKSLKKSSKKPAAKTSTKRKLKKLEMNDSDFSGDSDNNSPSIISSRNSTPRRTPRKLAGKDTNQTDNTKSTPRKTSQRKSTHK